MRADHPESLATGHGPGTPEGDNLLHDFVVGTARSWERFNAAAGFRYEQTRELALGDCESASDLLNWAVVLRPLAADAGEVVARARAFFGDRPGGPFLFVSAWPTPDLTEHGLHLVGYPPLMWRPASAPLRPPPADLAVVRVHDETTAADFERTLVDGYPIPSLQPVGRGSVLRVFDAAGWHYFVGYVNGEPVATAAAWVDATHVRVDLVATLPDRRGRGYGAAVTAAATAAEPELPAVLIASDAGRPVYERMGYTALWRCTVYDGDRAGARR
jgi:GNAT superfamily N-acetyltransferase